MLTLFSYMTGCYFTWIDGWRWYSPRMQSTEQETYQFVSLVLGYSCMLLAGLHLGDGY